MADEPTIIIGGDIGVHNKKPTKTRKRIKDGKGYRDLSTVMVCPTRGVIPARVVQSMMDMVPMMNQAFIRMFIETMEVAAAYNTAVETILNHPALAELQVHAHVRGRQHAAAGRAPQAVREHRQVRDRRRPVLHEG